MSIDRVTSRDAASASIKRGTRPSDGVAFKGMYKIDCYGPAEIIALKDVHTDSGETFTAGTYAAIAKRDLDLLEDGMVQVLTAPELKFSENPANLVVNEGLDHILSSTLAGGTQITSWFVGLTDNSPTPAAGDTMASHAGWTEFDEYSQATRVAWTAGAVSGQSVDNSGSVASFSINNSTNGGLGGAFLVSNSTKGGTTGTLYSVVALTGGNRVVNNGDTVEVTYTFTSADDGV